MQLFVETQAFKMFIERAYKSGTEKNEVSYFMEGAKSYQTLGRIGLDIHCKRAFTQATHSYQNVFLKNISKNSLQFIV